MARLGTVKNPMIMQVRDHEKAQEIAAICEMNKWQYIVGVKPGEEEDLADLNQKLDPPTVYSPPKTGRNDPCLCGSGKKYKKCCMQN